MTEWYEELTEEQNEMFVRKFGMTVEEWLEQMTEEDKKWIEDHNGPLEEFVPRMLQPNLVEQVLEAHRDGNFEMRDYFLELDGMPVETWNQIIEEQINDLKNHPDWKKMSREDRDAHVSYLRGENPDFTPIFRTEFQ